MVAMDRPDNGLPEEIREHMKLMCDIIAIALVTRLTTLSPTTEELGGKGDRFRERLVRGSSS